MKAQFTDRVGTLQHLNVPVSWRSDYTQGPPFNFTYQLGKVIYQLKLLKVTPELATYEHLSSMELP